MRVIEFSFSLGLDLNHVWELAARYFKCILQLWLVPLTDIFLWIILLRGNFGA